MSAFNGAYAPDNASGTGLDVYRNQEHTAPPPKWGKDGDDGGDKPGIWYCYTVKGHHYDKDLVDDANNTVDVLLIFAGLFSAVVTAFISQTYAMLKPDQGDIMLAVLQELQHPGSSPRAQSFTAPSHIIRVNCFLFAGLFISMIVALLSILVRQWARSYQRDLAGVSSPHLRARIRHFRYRGVKRWHFENAVGMLSIFMHVALFISAVGIIDLLLSTAKTVGIVALTIFAFGASIFAITNILPAFYADAPFRSPLSKFLTSLKDEALRIFHFRRDKREKKKQEEEGLEDTLEQSQGNESKENSIVRSQVGLDLDILSQLLGEADKSTERWLLDLCFEKFPQLSLLAKQDPDGILQRMIIVEVYQFLAKGCVTTNKYNKLEVDPTRLPRARKLCEFLTWFLSLQRRPEVRDRVRQALFSGRFDPKELPIALADDDITSMLIAYSALGRIEHLDDKGNEGLVCRVCMDDAQKFKTELKEGKLKEEGGTKRVIQSLIHRTDCLLMWDKPKMVNGKEVAGPDWNTARGVSLQAEAATMAEAIRICGFQDREKRALERALKDKESSPSYNASESLKTLWFKVLLEVIQTLPTGRSPSPWRINSSATTSPTPTLRGPTSPNPTGPPIRRPQASFGGSSVISNNSSLLAVPPNVSPGSTP